MFYIQSLRINLIPLQPSHMELWLQDISDMQKQLNITVSDFLIEESFYHELKNALRGISIPKIVAHADHYCWFTNWIITEKESNRMIGGIGFSGMPNERGESMVGYFIDQRFEGLGFATEALQRMLLWAFENGELKAVVADTLIEGIASQKVLQKNGFRIIGQDEVIHWKKDRE